jgi:hypothetical protein
MLISAFYCEQLADLVLRHYCLYALELILFSASFILTLRVSLGTVFSGVVPHDKERKHLLRALGHQRALVVGQPLVPHSPVRLPFLIEDSHVSLLAVGSGSDCGSRTGLSTCSPAGTLPHLRTLRSTHVCGSFPIPPTPLADESEQPDDRGHGTNRTGYLRRQVRFFLWKVAGLASAELLYLILAPLLRLGRNERWCVATWLAISANACHSTHTMGDTGSFSMSPRAVCSGILCSSPAPTVPSLCCRASSVRLSSFPFVDRSLYS